MLGILFAIILIVLMIFMVLFVWSPGKIDSYLYDNGDILAGSVSEITRIKIGGLAQGIVIKGKSDQNPVLLFLHGGPGNPEYVLAKDYSIGLEDYFTVCWWDQRGSGMSYSSSIQPETMTLEQMTADTVEVTNYLRKRFGKDKIYLMGHSWGSFLGVNTVSEHPDLYEAYIGIGQVTNQMESEKLGYDYMLASARADGNKKLEKKLLEYTLAGPDSISINYLMLRSDSLGKMGNGMFHIMKSKFNDILLPLLQAKEYTLADKYGYVMGSLFSLKMSCNESLYKTNIMDVIPELSIPVYIMHGVYDLQVSYDLSKDYFELLKAPDKHFYAFENSAHSPFIEEPGKFMEILKADVLRIK